MPCPPLLVFRPWSHLFSCPVVLAPSKKSLVVWFEFLVTDTFLINVRWALNLASFPGPAQLSVTCSTESWAGPGNEATNELMEHTVKSHYVIEVQNGCLHFILRFVIFVWKREFCASLLCSFKGLGTKNLHSKFAQGKDVAICFRSQVQLRTQVTDASRVRECCWLLHDKSTWQMRSKWRPGLIIAFLHNICRADLCTLNKWLKSFKTRKEKH